MLSVGLAYASWPGGLVRPEGYLAAAASSGLLFLLVVLWLAASRRCWFPDCEVSFYFFGCFAGLLAINGLVSVDRGQAVLETLKMCGFLLVALSFYHLRDQRLVLPFLVALIMTGVFYGLYGLAQWKGFISHGYWAEPGCVSSRFVNSVHFAGFLLIPLMAALGLFFAPVSWPWKILSLFSFPLLWMVMLKTHSRSGWLCFFIGAGVYAWLMGKSKWRGLSAVSKIVTVMAILCVVAGGIYLVHDDVYRRLSVLWSSRFQTLEQRFQVWTTSALIVLNYPLGIGAGNLSLVSPQFETVSDRFLIDYSHNEPLQIAIEYGILGLLIVFALVILYQRRMSRFFSLLQQTPGLLSAQAGLYAGVMGLAAQSLVDFPLRIPSIAFLLFAVVGFQLGMAKANVANSRKTNGPWWPRLLLGFLLVGTLAVVVEASCLWKAQRLLFNARQLAAGFLWDEARSAYARGSPLAPMDSYFDRGLGELLMQRVVLAKEKQPYLLKASHALEKAFKKSPLDNQTQKDLGKVCDLLGQKEDAERFYKLGVAGNPQMGNPYVRLVHFLIDRGMFEQAGMFYKLMMTLFCEDPGGGLDVIIQRCYAKTKNYFVIRKVVPKNSSAMVYLAQFFDGKGDAQGFDHAAREALDLAPNKLETAVQLLQYVSTKGDRHRVKRYAEMVLAIDPSNVFALDVIKSVGS